VVEAAASPDAERGPDADPTAEQVRAARAEAHKLAGSIGMFGLTEASALAQRLDDVVVAGAYARPGGRRQVLELAARLRQALDATG
jgi:HPt (histidine-containing phosphotransfer) domain-containing protein